MTEKQWPKAGSKVTYNGTHKFWFTNITKDAEDLLEIGKEYTVSKLELASSWCGVRVEEFPDKLFALSFFKYNKDLSTQEQHALEGRIPIRTLEELKNWRNNMGHSNYQLTDEQKKALDKIADVFIGKIESELANDIGGILDPYDTEGALYGKIDNNKLTRMLWYIGDYISAS